jgi:hypothetical protein
VLRQGARVGQLVVVRGRRVAELAQDGGEAAGRGVLAAGGGIPVAVRVVAGGLLRLAAGRPSAWR